MAEKKNFTIENYNGTDYDTLYPQTNSGQVLLDGVAQSELNLESGKTLDDALSVAMKWENKYRVGDVLTTARVDVGDKFVLCNGAILPLDVYPELSEILPHKTLLFDKLEQLDKSVTFEGTRINSFSLAIDNGGTQLAVAFETQASSYFYSNGYFINLNDLNSGWKSLSLGYNANYANGYWFRQNSYHQGNLTEDASFTTIKQETGETNPLNILQVLYHNGYYYMCGNSKVRIYSNLDLQPAQVISLTGTSSKYQMYIIPDGVIVFNPSGLGSDSSFILIKDDISTIKYTPWSSFGYGICTYFNGYYYYYRSETDMRRLYKSTILFENLETVYDFNSSDSISFATVTNDKLIFDNGYYVDKTGDIRQFDRKISGNQISNIVSGGDVLYQAALSTSSSPTTISIAKSSVEDTLLLPNYSPANELYAYMKVKS